jgi:hypothetical protein
MGRVNMSSLDAAYQAVALAGATRRSMKNFLEQAECVNTKLEAVIRVEQLVKIVCRYTASYFAEFVFSYNIVIM